VSEEQIEHRWDAELSDREVYSIGRIIVQWGALEHEIFTQTLLTFDAPECEQAALPKAMNNFKLTDVLALWKERVVDKAQGARSAVLQLAYKETLKLKPFRDAIVHGMWDFSASNLSGIRTVRIRKREILTTHFTAADLDDFYGRLGRVNFNIRFPGGTEDLAQQLQEQGSYFSRRFLAMMSGESLVNDWLTRPSASADNPEGENS